LRRHIFSPFFQIGLTLNYFVKLITCKLWTCWQSQHVCNSSLPSPFQEKKCDTFQCEIGITDFTGSQLDLNYFPGGIAGVLKQAKAVSFACHGPTILLNSHKQTGCFIITIGLCIIISTPHTHAHTRICKYVITLIHMHAHTYTHKYTHIHPHIYTHILNTHIQHTHTHNTYVVHTHSYRHTYAYTHTHNDMHFLLLLSPSNRSTKEMLLSLQTFN
jgi:hypothetical protein